MTGADGSAWAVPREARAYQGHRAGMVTRTSAAAVDSLTVLLIVGVGLIGLNGIHFALDPLRFRVVGLSQAALLSAVLGTAVLYLAATWSIVGRSYGCHLMGLRIVNRQGSSPGFWLALVRAAFCVVFPLGLLWCLLGRSRRSLQDLLLGTSVVYDWMPDHRTTVRPA
ncbi:MAG TPA: RDD family protein [Nocardioides sp.]|nr:RDD family protein [Nocardioides sp.]